MAGDDEPRGAPERPRRTLADVAKAHRLDGLTSVVNTEPCAREGLLYGIGTGIGAGVLGFFKRGSVLSAGNWGVAAFVAVAIAAKQLCHFHRAHQHAKNRTLLELQSARTPKVEGWTPRPRPSEED
ncbi:hypothetical protein H4R18_003933 [Coemansia javaensis]|uniref:Cytochrome c oxidase assembly protein COX20, mitochondrial n=1 Tax=Coemansia javaensis TaxID=2761396 RepID=A0A9W8LHM4_9FUNG|nr:hypothetical protein H4R18_003933 [Coemansia javaensis]